MWRYPGKVQDASEWWGNTAEVIDGAPPRRCMAQLFAALEIYWSEQATMK